MRLTRRIAIAGLAFGWTMLPLAQAGAQDAPTADAASAPSAPAASAVELKAAAYDAQMAAKKAQDAAAAAHKQAADAHAAVQSLDAGTPQPEAAVPAPISTVTPPFVPEPAPAPAPPIVPVPVPVATVPVAVTTVPPPVTTPSDSPPAVALDAAPTEPAVTQEDLQRVTEKAEHAASEARRAREELEAFKAAYKARYARRGFTISAGAFYAPQFFDTSAHVVSSKGLSGGIGYRIHPHFSIESNFNWVQGFAISETVNDGSGLVFYSGDLSMWSATVGGKLYLLTRKVQPYIGFGFGASGGKATFRAGGVEDIKFKEFGGTIAFNAGLEFYVSDTLAIGADAAIFLPGGNLGGLDYSTLGGKLIYRF